MTVDTVYGSSLRQDIRRLMGKSTVYGLGSLGAKAIGFLLIPVYTRFLVPADYGITAIASSLVSIAVLVLSLQLPGAIGRFYFDTADPIKIRRTIGTLWMAMAFFCLSAVILLDQFGGSIFASLFPEVPFSPYLRLALWAAALQIMGLVPLTLFQVREKPIPYTLLTLSKLLLAIVLTIYLVVFQNAGALGVVAAGVIAGLALLVPNLWLVWRQASPVFSRSILKAGLAFSLPTIPHGLAFWVLELSDRVLLARYVSLPLLGIYSIGYQIGSIVNLLGIAIINALTPMVYRTLTEEGTASHARLSRIITYFVAFIAAVGMLLVIYMESIFQIITPSSYHAAVPIARVVLAGQFFHVLYYCSVMFIFYSKRTIFVPIITGLAGMLNVGINLLLIPRIGIMGAAIATIGGYALMAILAWFFSHRIYPFPFEYRRLFLFIFFSVTWSIVGMQIRLDTYALSILLQTAWLAAFPFALWFSGFFDEAEKAEIWRMAKRGWRVKS